MTRGKSPQQVAARQNLKASCVQYIADNVAERGYPPSIHELCSYLGYRSTQSVHTLLVELEAEGRIRRVKGSPRAITVVPDHP